MTRDSGIVRHHRFDRTRRDTGDIIGRRLEQSRLAKERRMDPKSGVMPVDDLSVVRKRVAELDVCVSHLADLLQGHWGDRAHEPSDDERKAYDDALRLLGKKPSI